MDIQNQKNKGTNMNVVTPGHLYILESLEDTNPQYLQFIQKEKIEDKFVTIKDGTTNEEVLKVMIDRLKTLDEKLPSRENAIVITKLEEALMWVEKRSNIRKTQGVYGTPLPHKS